MKRVILLGLAISALLAMTGVASASAPRLMSFQGKLTNIADQPLTGDYNFTFRIYGAATGGAALWTEVQNAVAVETGIYNVLLGSVTPLNLAFDTGYWLSVEVGADGEMSPRYRLTSAPYSLFSDTATNAVSGGGSGLQRIVVSGTFDTSAAGDTILNGAYHYKLVSDARLTLSDMPQVQVFYEQLIVSDSGSIGTYPARYMDVAGVSYLNLYWFQEGKVYLLYKKWNSWLGSFDYVVVNNSKYYIVLVQ